ncbi:MAG: hypothetical protein ACREVO_08150 [Steroidobacteraceae bacterium]
MAYDATKLRMFAQGGVYGPQGDAHATVEVDGYVADGGDRGMKVGDLVFVIESTGGGTTAHSVTAVAAGTDPYSTPGAATISAGEFA